MLNITRCVLTGLASLALAGGAWAQHDSSAAHYPQDADASAVIDAALAQARDEDKQALIVFGADWCHDSRGLAEMLDDAIDQIERAAPPSDDDWDDDTDGGPDARGR